MSHWKSWILVAGMQLIGGVAAQAVVGGFMPYGVVMGSAFVLVAVAFLRGWTRDGTLEGDSMFALAVVQVGLYLATLVVYGLIRGGGLGIAAAALGVLMLAECVLFARMGFPKPQGQEHALRRIPERESLNFTS